MTTELVRCIAPELLLVSDMTMLLPLTLKDRSTLLHEGTGVAVGGFRVRVGVHEGTSVRVGVRVGVGVTVGVRVGRGVRVGVGVSVGMGAQARPSRQPPEPDGVPATPSAFCRSSMKPGPTGPKSNPGHGR